MTRGMANPSSAAAANTLIASQAVEAAERLAGEANSPMGN